MGDKVGLDQLVSVLTNQRVEHFVLAAWPPARGRADARVHVDGHLIAG